MQYKQVSVFHKEWFGSLSPDNKVGVANMGPTWVLLAPGGTMNHAIREA